MSKPRKKMSKPRKKKEIVEVTRWDGQRETVDLSECVEIDVPQAVKDQLAVLLYEHYREKPFGEPAPPKPKKRPRA